MDHTSVTHDRRAVSRRRRHLLVAAAAALAVGATACTGGRPPRSTTTTLPKPGACRNVDFEEASVESQPPSSAAQGFRLTVAGRVTSSNLRVNLVPVTYIQQPEYWLIEVVACQHGDIGAPVVTPFKVTLDVTNTMGTEGIEVAGATKRQRIDVPPKPAPPLAGSGWVLDPTSLGVPAAGQPVTLTFSATNVGGISACNHYGAPYTATGSATAGSFKITGPMVSTLIGCPPDVANVEATYLRKLSAATTYHLAEGALTLSGPQGRLVFATPPPTRP